jgi:WhiB family redox-sensing transcriptional regulator
MALKGPWEFKNPSCSSAGVDQFYQDLDAIEVTSTNEQNQVISICKQCPCITDCAEWGISKERWGIWGGLTPRERERIRRKRRRSGSLVHDIGLLP